MPNYCAVFGCTSSSFEKERSFHKIPNDEPRKSHWISRIRRINFKVTSNSFVCDLHFEAADYKNVKSDRPVQFQKRVLIAAAVPSLLRWKMEPACDNERTIRASKRVRIDED